jgi:hypothetical protein
VTRDSLGSRDEEDFPQRKYASREYFVRDIVRSKERDPHRDVVATEGDTHHERRDNASPVLLAHGLASRSPRVNSEYERGDAEQTRPAQWHRAKQGTNSESDDDQGSDAERLGDAETLIARPVAECELSGEGEKVIDHRSNERK